MFLILNTTGKDIVWNVYNGFNCLCNISRCTVVWMFSNKSRPLSEKEVINGPTPAHSSFSDVWNHKTHSKKILKISYFFRYAPPSFKCRPPLSSPPEKMKMKYAPRRLFEDIRYRNFSGSRIFNYAKVPLSMKH